MQGRAILKEGAVASEKVPIHRKILLTLEEAAAYSGIGVNRLRELSHDPDFADVIYISGKRRLFKRRPLREYLEMSGGVCYDG